MTTPKTHDVQSEVKTSLKFLGILGSLVLLTVLRKYLHWPVVYSIFIEIIKGGIVVGYFSYLIAGRKVIHLVWFLTIILAAGLLLLPFFHRLDRQKGSEDILTQGMDQGQIKTDHVH